MNNHQLSYKFSLTENVKVIGLGKAGTLIANELHKLPTSSYLDIAAVDTDKSLFSNSNLPNNFIIGEEWTNGKGCGGNIIKGERALAHKSNVQIKNFLNHASILILTGGLGKGTVTGGANVIARLAQQKNIPVIFILTLPFSFEGNQKQKISEKQIKEFARKSYTVIPIPNDILFSSSSADISFKRAFTEANIQIARAIFSITELIRCDNIIPIDLASMSNVLSRQKCECSIGISLSEETDTTKTIIDRLLDSPLLGGKTNIKNADKIILSVIADNSISIGKIKNILDKISQLASQNTEIIVGANTDKNYEKKIQLIVIPVKFNSSEVYSNKNNSPIIIHPAESENQTIKEIEEKNKRNIHPDLPFENFSRGIFTNTVPTIYKGEDLDIPTYQRKKIILYKGEVKLKKFRK